MMNGSSSIKGYDLRVSGAVGQMWRSWRVCSRISIGSVFLEYIITSFTFYPEVPSRVSPLNLNWWGLVARFMDLLATNWGNRQELRGCWGRKALEKSSSPGITSTSITADNLSRKFSKESSSSPIVL